MNKNCYIWTRVSTKYQEDNGGSLNDQKCACETFAREHEYNIKGYFGGTHESAKTPGKLIKEMISALKRDKTVKFILVKNADRFSRDAGQAMGIISDLRKHGIEIVETATALDTTTPEGLMMIQMKICMAQWDNTNRTNKFVSGRKHCLESGVYCGSLPLGYNKEGKSISATFSINDTGKLIRKAFKWKLQGLANHQIMTKLSAYGLDLSKQKLHKILTNPFYAGKIKHKMLDGRIIDGNQPPIISYEDFLRVQDILSGRTGTYIHRKETPRFPLKRYVRCAKDNTPFTAYTVKRKNIDYYKCNLDGCRTNVSAKKMHSRYEDVLKLFSIPHQLKNTFREVVNDVLIEDSNECKQMITLLKKQKSEYENKLKNCKIKYGMGEIDEDIYKTTNEALQDKLNKIALEMANCKRDLSNYVKRVEEVVSMCCKLECLWGEASIELAQKLQYLVFPNGIFWDKEIDNYRTNEANSVLGIISKISASYENKKEENSLKSSSLVNLCARRDSNPHVVRH